LENVIVLWLENMFFTKRKGRNRPFLGCWPVVAVAAVRGARRYKGVGRKSRPLQGSKNYSLAVTPPSFCAHHHRHLLRADKGLHAVKSDRARRKSSEAVPTTSPIGASPPPKSPSKIWMAKDATLTQYKGKVRFLVNFLSGPPGASPVLRSEIPWLHRDAAESMKRKGFTPFVGISPWTKEGKSRRRFPSWTKGNAFKRQTAKKFPMNLSHRHRQADRTGRR